MSHPLHRESDRFPSFGRSNPFMGASSADLRRQHGPDNDEDEPEPPAFNARDIAHIAVLSRIVETLRFTVGPSLLDTMVTQENLIMAFHDHEALEAASRPSSNVATDSAPHTPPNSTDAADANNAASKRNSDTAIQQRVALSASGDLKAQSTRASLSAVEDRAAAKLQEVWRIVEACHSGPLDFTYGDLFDFEFPSFPETTAEQRSLLAVLENDREVITRRMVADTLGVDTTDQTVEFLFASGADAIPAVVFEELVQSLGRHPQTHSFAPHFVEQRCLVGRRMLLMLPQLLALIVTVTIAPWVVNVEQRVIHENMMHWINNDWTMGCPGGATAHIASNATECNFLGMTFLEMNRPTQDGLRFLREQLPLLLWTNASASAADTPLGGVFPVGVLTVRHVTERTNDDRCSDSGISTTTKHWEVPATFGCGNEWAIQIPFSATRDEATAALASVDLPAPGKTHDAIIAEFPGYSPTVRMTVYSRIVMTLPRGGGVWPKLFITPVDHEAHMLVFLVFIAKLLGTIWAVVVAVRYRLTSRSFSLLNIDFMLDVLMLVLITSSYGFLVSVAGVPKGLLDVTAPYSDVDDKAERFNVGMSLFGAYCFLVVGSFARFARDIAGLQVLMDIMRSAAMEILGLGVLFAVWTTGFVFAAMVLFSYTTPEYSSFLPAARSLLLYYIGVNDITLLSQNNPRIGPIFFVVFQIFVVFFAMNLLIAVLTAPLPLIKERTNLVRDTFVATRSHVGDGRGWWARFRLEFGYFFLWPFVNTMLDAVPWAHRHYLRCFDVLETFYTFSDAKMEAVDSIDKALDLLHLLSPGAAKTSSDEEMSALNRRPSSPSDMNNYGTEGQAAVLSPSSNNLRTLLWDSPLLETVLEQETIGNSVALSIVLVIIAEESEWTVVRDARLLRMLAFYEGFSSRMHRVLKLQEAYRTMAADRTRAVARIVDRAAGLLPSPVPYGANTSASGSGPFPPPSSTSLATVPSQRTLIVSPERGVASQARISQRRGFTNVALQNNNSNTNNATAATVGTTNAAPALNASPRSENKASAEGPPREGEEGTAATAVVVVENAVARGLAFFFQEETADPFAFTRELRGQMTQATTFMFLIAITAIAACIFFLPFFTSVEYTAFLSDALDAGILDMPWRTRCYDAECVRSWSKNKTLLEVGDLGEYTTWLSDVLEEQLYRREMDSLPYAEFNSTYFDSRIRLNGPFTIRQIRGKHTSCGSFGGTSTGPVANRSFYADRQKFVDRFQCVLGAASGFTTAPMPAPPGGYPPLIGKSAYVEEDVCAEDEPKSFAGRFALSYPCRGYTAKITNHAALREVIGTRWIDTETRLVAVTANFLFGYEAVEYTTLTELAEKGGAATSAGFSFPTATKIEESHLSDTRITFQILIILQLLFHGAMLGWYLIQRFCRGRSADEASDILPDFPVVAVIVAVLIFGVFQIAFPPSSQPLRHNTAVGLCAIVYFGYMLTAFLIFPLASLLSRKMTVLIATLVAQLLYVVPYAIVAFFALTFMAYVTWGRFLHEYSRLPWAAQEVIVMAFGGGVDVEPLQAQRFVEAQIFTAFVFAVFIVVLSNLFLAMVTSASGDAQETPLSTELVEGVLELAGERIVYGRFYSFGLAFIVFAIRGATNDFVAKFVPRSWTSKRKHMPVICTYRGRLLYPTEALFGSFSPLRCTATLRFFCHDTLPLITFASLMPYLLELHRNFERRQVQSASEDRKKEKAEARRYAVSHPTLAHLPVEQDGTVLASENTSVASSPRAQASDSKIVLPPSRTGTAKKASIRGERAEVTRGEEDHDSAKRGSLPPSVGFVAHSTPPLAAETGRLPESLSTPLREGEGVDRPFTLEGGYRGQPPRCESDETSL